jgi:hypothetical protein
LEPTPANQKVGSSNDTIRFFFSIESKASEAQSSKGCQDLGKRLHTQHHAESMPATLILPPLTRRDAQNISQQVGR